MRRFPDPGYELASLSFSFPLVIGIPARNEAACFSGLLGAIKAGTVWTKAPSREFVVCLNGCSDESRRVLESLKMPDFQLDIAELEEGDKNQALNHLIARCHALSPYIVIVDAEVVPDPTAIEVLLKRLESDTGIDLAAAVPRPFLGLPNTSWYQRCRVKYARSAWLSRGSGETTFPRANLYAIRSEVARNLRFPTGTLIGDDYFFSHVLGSRAAVEPAATVYFTPPTLRDHFRQRTRQRWGLQQFKELYPALREPRKIERVRRPAPAGLEEALFFLTVVAQERVSRLVARHAAAMRWRNIPSARPGFTGGRNLRKRLLTPLQRMMVKGSRYRLFRFLLVQVYRTVARLWAAVMNAQPGVEACAVAGSTAGKRLHPGLSDLDTTLVIQDLQPDQEREVVESALRRHTQLRLFFPIIQEPVTFRKSEMVRARECGEPWLTDRHYQVLAGPPLTWLGSNEHNRDAHLALFLRRFLRFFTRQALTVERRGLARYVRLHPVGLASMNRLLLWSRGTPAEERLGPVALSSEIDRPAGPEMARLFGLYLRLERDGPLPGTAEEIGPSMASDAFLILQTVASGFAGRPGPHTPLEIAPITEPAAARALRQRLQALLGEVRSEPRLRDFRPILSSAGVHAWQYRLYLLADSKLEREAIEQAYRALASIWSRHAPSFPAARFGVFPNPCLLPADALSLIHFSFQGSFERAYLHATLPDLGVQPTSQEVNTTIFRDVAERGYLVLRRLDMKTAPTRTSLRFLDTFYGLVPAIWLWLKEGRIVLGPGKAAEIYQQVFSDHYSDFLARLEPKELWFNPRRPSKAKVYRLQTEYYSVLRQRLDQIQDHFRPGGWQ